ncbi:hypothetical protein BO82DRAFT_369216 [Aspergillus uvarum CBS 121591]|uniref:Uncharacterized protein n=1 Tax=Aspergillus uvarum CBS 121591 TaxID=1448315 RepID=A0A319BWP3_9EURO|nr:hypothetical protein BO82DRAFT_369216 [Aspergillus uvarum CBS 121591]PYH76637.1 hypothetical protein BO82DRAFT_369216 [Aspergillus uvarum CBS 121591]
MRALSRSTFRLLLIISSFRDILADEFTSTSALANCGPNTAISVTYFDAKLTRSGTMDIAFTLYLDISGNVPPVVLLVIDPVFLTSQRQEPHVHGRNFAGGHLTESVVELTQEDFHRLQIVGLSVMYDTFPDLADAATALSFLNDQELQVG